MVERHEAGGVNIVVKGPRFVVMIISIEYKQRCLGMAGLKFNIHTLLTLVTLQEERTNFANRRSD